MPEPLDGLAAADAHLGRPFPLPAAALPLTRWVEVRAVGPGAEVEFNLDDSREGAPGRLALYAGPVAPPDQLSEAACPVEQTKVRGLRAAAGAAGRRAALAAPRGRGRLDLGRAAPASHRPGPVGAGGRAGHRGRRVGVGSSPMNFGRLTRAELAAIGGGILLGDQRVPALFGTEGDGEIDGEQGTFRPGTRCR